MSKLAIALVLLSLGLNYPLTVSAEGESLLETDPTGLCLLGDLSGRWVEGASGRMMPLHEVCGRLPNGEGDAAAASEDPAADAADPAKSMFWRAFLNAAGEEAIAFAEAIPVEDIVAYGTTICPMLEDGHTLQEVRTVQATSDLPASFDAAVNVAAIHTFCPQYATQIGR
ncbi:MAG: DUF732 domain-containing protein [Elainellaceae cyanobacterium]